MSQNKLSLKGGLVGAGVGLAAEVAFQEITGHHITTGLLELLGAAAGLWRLDRRLAESLRDTLDKTREDRQDYRQVKARIAELTQDLPELREILSNMVDAGIAAQKA